jgi:alkyl hydroperoxide reductase subunit AhpC
MESMGVEDIPMLSDFWPHGQVAQAYGVLREHGMTERAIFIIDKQGVIQYIDVHDFSSLPDNQVLFEVLETLE